MNIMNRALAQVIVQNYDNIQQNDKEETKQAFKMFNMYHPIYNPIIIPWGIWHKNRRVR